MTEAAPLPSGSRAEHEAILTRAIRETGETRPVALILKLMGDALETVRRLPDQERRWLKSGTRTAWQIPSGLTQGEARQLEKARALAGIRTTENVPQRTERGAESSLLVMEWLRFIRMPADPGLHGAFLALLSGDDRQAAVKIWRPTRKYSRTSVAEIRTRAVSAILKGLRREFGLDLVEMMAGDGKLAA